MNEEEEIDEYADNLFEKELKEGDVEDDEDDYDIS